jgi:hypothetical protein
VPYLIVWVVEANGSKGQPAKKIVLKTHLGIEENPDIG